MPTRASRDVDITINSVAVECYVNNFSQNLEQENLDVTVFCTTGPRSVPGNYNWGAEISGPWDGANAAIDHTVWGTLGSTGVAYSAEMTGVAGTTNAPEYSGTIVLRNYTIRAAVGQPITYSAAYQGNSAITRTAS